MAEKPRRTHGFLQNEQGDWSLGRVSFLGSLIATFFLIMADTFVAWVAVPDLAYDLLGTIFTGLLAWVAGPRVARYLADIRGAKRPPPVFDSSGYRPQPMGDEDAGGEPYSREATFDR